MANLADYFANRDRDLAKATYDIGDRVYAKWNKIPVVASVLREENLMVLMQPDLPLLYKGVIQNILTVPVKDVKLLKEL